MPKLRNPASSVYNLALLSSRATHEAIYDILRDSCGDARYFARYTKRRARMYHEISSLCTWPQRRYIVLNISFVAATVAQNIVCRRDCRAKYRPSSRLSRTIFCATHETIRAILLFKYRPYYLNLLYRGLMSDRDTRHTKQTRYFARHSRQLRFPKTN